MHNTGFVILMTITSLILIVKGSHLKMPSFSFVGESVTMDCDIDHGDLPIISITWSKDGHQFYKYDPHNSDPVTITSVPGVQVKEDSRTLDGNRLVIGSVSLESTGVYSCNVKIDHASMDIGEMTGTLKVV